MNPPNLKAIISDYKGFSRNHVIGSNIFLVSRDEISRYIKDYYAHCYGIRVIDKTEVQIFFKKLNTLMPDAETRQKRSILNIRAIIFEDKVLKPEYIKIENSFFETVSSLAAMGLSINDARVVEALGKIITKKIELTKDDSAWTQYEHLASWLIYLATILELKNTSIETIYLKASLHSMKTMSKKLSYGYSWQAYRLWSNRWSGIIASNRLLIRSYIEINKPSEDALSVVKGA